MSRPRITPLRRTTMKTRPIGPVPWSSTGRLRWARPPVPAATDPSSPGVPKTRCTSPSRWLWMPARSERSFYWDPLSMRALALDTADSIGAKDSLEKMLAHQMALSHKLAFDFANRAVAQTDPTMTIKLANVSAKLMDTFQRGLLTSRNSGQATVRRSRSSTRTFTRAARLWWQGRCRLGASQKSTGSPRENEGQPHATVRRPALWRQDSLRRRLPIPAVRGRHRCRMHGGNSPGAPRGNQHALKHGHYSVAGNAQRRGARQNIRELRRLMILALMGE